jgi:hypothetical protein
MRWLKGRDAAPEPASHPPNALPNSATASNSKIDSKSQYNFKHHQ